MVLKFKRITHFWVYRQMPILRINSGVKGQILDLVIVLSVNFGKSGIRVNWTTVRQPKAVGMPLKFCFKLSKGTLKEKSEEAWKEAGFFKFHFYQISFLFCSQEDCSTASGSNDTHVTTTLELTSILTQKSRLTPVFSRQERKSSKNRETVFTHKTLS